MKPLILIALLLFSFAVPVYSAEVTYVATMSGIDCTDCKRKISRSLGKLKGVETIRIVKMSGDRHRLTVITDGSKNITMSDAKQSLKGADHYSILSWKKGG